MDRPKQDFRRCPKPLQPTDESTTSLFSTTTDTTTDSSTVNSEQSKQLSTNKPAADSSADSAIPDIRVNRSRQVPPSVRLPKEGSLGALLTVTPICAMWTDEGWTKTVKSMSERLGELQPVISQLT